MNDSAPSHAARARPAAFDWADPLLLEEQLTEDERMIRDTARGYAQDRLAPRILEAYREERFDRAIMPEMGDLGLLGATIPEEYGGAGAGYVAYGLVAREIERVDSGYRSSAFGPVVARHVPDPRLRHRRAAARSTCRGSPPASSIGCFGLTEPDAGSDPGGMRTARQGRRRLPPHRRQDLDHQRPLRRRLRRLGQVRGPRRRIKGFLLEKGMPGLTAPKIEGKLSLRASVTGMIVMDDVEVARGQPAPGAEGLAGPFGCLNRARYGISWGAMGAAEVCWHAARALRARPQAVRPPARRQTSSSRRSSPTCRPRSPSACRARCASAACSTQAASRPR